MLQEAKAELLPNQNKKRKNNGMKNKEPLRFYPVPKLPCFLKIEATKEVVKCMGLNEKTHEYDIESTDGKQKTVSIGEISNDVTQEQEMEYLKKRPDVS